MLRHTWFISAANGHSAHNGAILKKISWQASWVLSTKHKSSPKSVPLHSHRDMLFANIGKTEVSDFLAQLVSNFTQMFKLYY